MAFADIFIQVDHADLKRGKASDLKGTYLFVVNLRFIVGQIYRPPHASREQHRILAHNPFGNIDEIFIDCCNHRPVLIFRFDQPHL